MFDMHVSLKLWFAYIPTLQLPSHVGYSMEIVVPAKEYFYSTIPLGTILGV